MPHLQLEVSANVAELDDLQAIIRRLVDVMSTFETVQPAALKGYVRVATTYATGEGAPPGFAHLTARVLAGRAPELRSMFADQLFDQMNECFARSLAEGRIGVTVEICEMDPATYRKHSAAR